MNTTFLTEWHSSKSFSPYIIENKLTTIPKVKDNVIVKCPKCGNEKTTKLCSHLRTIRKNNGKYVCHKCSINKEACSNNAKKLWADPEKANKIRSHLQSDEMKKIVRDNNKKLFSDQAFVENWKTCMNKERISESTKERWKNEEYRKKMRGILSKRATNQWKDPNFLEKMKTYWKSDKHKEKVTALKENPKYKESMRRLWSDREFRTKIVQTKMEFYRKRREERLSLLSSLPKKDRKNPWDNEDYRKKMMGKFDEDRRKMISKANKEIWNTEKRNAASNKTKKLWAVHEYRNKIVNALKNNEHIGKLSKARWENQIYRENLTKAICESWNDPELIESVRSKVNEYYSDPIVRSIFSELSIEKWNNPEYRDLVSDHLKKFWDDPEHRKKVSDQLKARWKDPTYREKMAVVRLNQPKTSFQQEILYSLLRDLKVVFHDDKSEACKIGFYCFDCRIDPQPGLMLSKSLLIEVQGDYWHALPDVVRRDKGKSTYLKTYFPEFDLKYLWEHEFDNKDRIKGLLGYWLGLEVIPVKSFSFNDVMMKIIGYQEAEIFISAHHYAGRVGRSGVNLGFFVGNELAGVIIFSCPVRQEVALKQGLAFHEVLELSRLAINPAFQVRNLASFMISRAVAHVKTNCLKIKLLVSFADKSYNHTGTIYKASNWIFDGEVAPDYWYADDRGYVCHKKTLWNKAKKFGLSESEYACRFGYSKIWGEGKLRFKLCLNASPLSPSTPSTRLEHSPPLL